MGPDHKEQQSGRERQRLMVVAGAAQGSRQTEQQSGSVAGGPWQRLAVGGSPVCNRSPSGSWRTGQLPNVHGRGWARLGWMGRRQQQTAEAGSSSGLSIQD